MMMKKKNYKTLLFLILALISIHSSISAQDIQFAYDDFGNRISRDIIWLNGTSSEVVIAEQEGDIIQGELSDISITISPNPNGGQFIVELKNNSSQEFDMRDIQLYLHDLAGDQIFYLNEISHKNQVDINNQPNGIYILSVVIGEKKITWKVVKA